MHRRHISSQRLFCEALSFPCGTTQPPPPGEETASGRVKVCFKTEQRVYNHPAADVVLKKHGRAPGCGQSCPLTARVRNDVMIRSGLDLDHHEPWLLQTYCYLAHAYIIHVRNGIFTWNHLCCRVTHITVNQNHSYGVKLLIASTTFTKNSNQFGFHLL